MNINNEIYLNHPTFGLLYRVCSLSDRQEIYTTLYAQRLFFSVTVVEDNLSFESISRSEARLLIENRLRRLRNSGFLDQYQQLQAIHQRIFQ